MSARVVLPLLVLLSACTGGSSAPPAASVAPSPAPTASPSPSSPSSSPPAPSPLAAAPPGALLLAVAAGPGQLSLYAVAPGSHAATLVRRLEGPAGLVDSVSLSSGPTPTVCATWQERSPDGTVTGTELRCYRPGAARGRVIARDVQTVGVRSDGRAVAWVDGQYNSGLFVADLAGDVATVRTRERYVAGAPATAGIPEGISEIDWIGSTTLGLTDVADSDEGKGLCVYVVGEARAKEGGGFGRCLQPGPQEKGFDRFEQAAPVAAGVVVAVERPMWCCSDEDRKPDGRAVRVRLSDGAVMGVVATPRVGRDVVDVSGGSRAVLYATALPGDKDIVISLRWADEARGAPVTGLPTDLRLATAQP